MLIPAISLTIGSLQYSLEKGAAKAEFTDSKFSINMPPFDNKQVLLYYDTYASKLQRIKNVFRNLLLK